ncbi:type II toxin-antitoxin system Phd/YefM family antitoxin [Undibacterium baiyunense]|uniref:Antitoxin n=1 Tax=Undibacterium baiyunense TaxID=2828731 RepID=A0A941DCX1_9BURK|nr:type II toxin-antitoxin system Phd/YefM family antitoxin [Undibacterium baiyunense]MBR7745915.1 type II toxin-antitoxin system Phd/YefM family antitoxin [Undibacterium baiyunense]
MRFSERVKPISYFKDNAAKAIAEMTETHEPLIITQNGEATCAIQDFKSYEDTKNTMALLKILALGRKQIEEGQFKPAREVFAKIDKEILE